MILLAEKTITLNYAVAEAFYYLTNMENYGAWFPGVIQIESADQQAHATVGKRYQERLELPDGEVSLIIEVKECLSDAVFYTEGELHPLFPAMKMQFQSVDETTTQFHLSYYTRNPELTEGGELTRAFSQDLSARIEVAASNLAKLDFSV